MTTDIVYPRRTAPLRGATLGFALLALTACTQNPYRDQPPSAPPPARPPVQQGPRAVPPPPPAPPVPSRPSVQPAHPRYAPPPHAAAHWDNRLGVYVVEGRDLYYRERVYYRESGGWQSAPHPDGPWEPVAPVSVPPGLRQR